MPPWAQSVCDLRHDVKRKGAGCSRAIVSSSVKEGIIVKPAFALTTALLLWPLAPQAQNPPAAVPPPQNPATRVQHEANFDSERHQANQLYLAQKPLEALPLYEDLCRQDPTIAVFAERHAGGLLARQATVDDPKQKQAIMAEAIKELQRAESLGDNSPWVEGLLGTLAKTPVGLMVGGPMGALPLTVGYFYNGSAQAQPLMQQGETAFGHNDYPAALKFYLAAAAADPTWYMPALFSGDMYYRLKDVTNASVWFAKAIAIDPDRETAYRYWGDALMHSGDTAGARVKFEQAIAAATPPAPAPQTPARAASNWRGAPPPPSPTERPASLACSSGPFRPIPQSS